MFEHYATNSYIVDGGNINQLECMIIRFNMQTITFTLSAYLSIQVTN